MGDVSEYPPAYLLDDPETKVSAETLKALVSAATFVLMSSSL